jgi:predicted phosphodiesterase
MRYAIFSDIHSNLEALESIMFTCEKEGIDKYLCAGDIVGYGANPKECINIVQGRNIIAIAGNHDWVMSGKFDIEYFNPYAREAVFWTRDQVSKYDLDYLDNLSLVYKEGDFCLVHGTLLNPQYFDYLFELSDAQDSFRAMDTDVCFVGHTHYFIAFVKDDKKISYSRESNIIIKPGKKYIINVGSIGQPRDRDWRSCFCIYDSKDRSIQIKRTEYDVKSAQSKILKAALPHFLAARLELGQ